MTQKSFDRQVERAIALGLHLHYYKSEKAFSRWLAPLRQKVREAKGLKAHLPALLVIPHTAMPVNTPLLQRRMLARSLRFACQKVVVGFETNSEYLGFFEDTVEIPTEPYLALGVSIGAELSGPPNEGHAEVELKATNSLPLTLDEGLWFALEYEKIFAGARLLGTRYTGSGDDGWADIHVSRDKLTIDDHDKSTSEHTNDFWVPYCKKRVTAKLG